MDVQEVNGTVGLWTRRIKTLISATESYRNESKGFLKVIKSRLELKYD